MDRLLETLRAGADHALTRSVDGKNVRLLLRPGGIEIEVDANLWSISRLIGWDQVTASPESFRMAIDRVIAENRNAEGR